MSGPDTVQTTARISEPIPLNPSTPELTAREREILTAWDAQVAEIEAAGWVIEYANTMNNPPTNTYRKYYSFTRTQPSHGKGNDA
ncbi:hypothetical protein Lxx07660 [Leifsonia xyli subsp. xyli str. CTCB07]|uniref:Uncharacterized protein n=2 Tax=Leifsonia xyli subsp. xyli TaxID=59736 RepID=Q6AG13_LEIXX|nr:hypothetical protein [Leifsonia xyli]AAT88682.1 hypothetical protein Lxx07660 [Leifsonia xyli subsp. xyli str. CTCB07]